MIIKSQISSIPKVMLVYNFSLSNSEIQQELMKVFSSGSRRTDEQWTAQAELIMEPVGWEALWKLSKQFCKKFEVRFPCIAYVTVMGVNFNALSAYVEVQSVQLEAVSLPKYVEEVPLVEFWPTTQQREECINVIPTADFIHLMRFYYRNIWMPWDDVYRTKIQPETIRDRMQLWMEIQNGTIPSCLLRTIALLRSSAVNAYETLKVLDDTHDDDESPSYLFLFAELNARIGWLKSKFGLYEDPIVREHYGAKMIRKWQELKDQRNVVALWRYGPSSELEEISLFLRDRVSDVHTIRMVYGAEEALEMEPEELIVCSPDYDFPEMPLSDISLCSFKGATLTSPDLRESLLTLSDACRVRGLSLRCALVGAAVVMRPGELHMVDCEFTDDTQPRECDFAHGIIAKSGSKILLENCTFDNLHTGIVVHQGAKVELRNCTIRNCGVGIQMYADSEVKLDNTSITDCKEQCVRCELEMEPGKDLKSIEDLQIMPNCKIGSGDAKKEILIVHQYGHSL